MVDRLTGRQVKKYGIPIMPCTHIFNLALSTMVRLIGLSTMVRLIGPESNKGAQGIMDIRYLFIYWPVNLSTRVDRSNCKHIISRHYG